MRRNAVLAGAALVTLVLAAYLPALGGGFVWDDDSNITERPALRSAAGLRAIWTTPGATQQYYPLTHTSFWLEFQLFGLDPAPYHLTNVLLHGIASLLLWRILRRLAIPGAWFAAALFALHPVNVESVAWITERKNTLSLVFALGAVLVFLRWAFGAERRGWRAPAAVLLLFACALLSKTVTATVPFSLAAVLLWKRGGRLRRPDAALLGAMTAMGIAMGWVTARLEQVLVGAQGDWWALTFPERILVASRAFWFYLGKLAWPDVMFIYPRWRIDAAAAWQYAFPLAAVALAVALLWLARRRGAGPLVAATHFALSIGPALGFFNVYFHLYSFVADHFQYIACIGPLALAGAAAARCAARLPRAAAVALAVLLLLPLGAKTWIGAGDYRDEETLWRASIRHNPQAWMAQYNLARLLAERDELGEAETLLEKALRHNPDDADALNLLGNLHARRGRPAAALDLYRRAIAAQPNYALAHHNLGNALERLERRDEAIAAYTEALRLDPRLLEARNNLAVALAQRGDYAAAREQVRLLRRHGGRPNREFVRLLEERLQSADADADDPSRRRE